MNFCRDSCVNIKDDYISDSERQCIKNCSYKYLEQFSVFNSFKDNYENKFGTGIFLFDKEHKKSLSRLADLVKLNQSQNY
jgi:hypothetical protein